MRQLKGKSKWSFCAKVPFNSTRTSCVCQQLFIHHSFNKYTHCDFTFITGAMSYAELGTTIRKSGGEYSYLLSAFGPLNKHVGNIPAFLFAWVNMMLLKPASVAIITLTFATYCMQPFYDVCSPPASAKRMLAILCVCKYQDIWARLITAVISLQFTLFGLAKTSKCIIC